MNRIITAACVFLVITAVCVVLAISFGTVFACEGPECAPCAPVTNEYITNVDNRYFVTPDNKKLRDEVIVAVPMNILRYSDWLAVYIKPAKDTANGFWKYEFGASIDLPERIDWLWIKKPQDK